MIRSTTHNLLYSNKEKNNKLSSLLTEYRKVAKLILNDIWTNGYSWTTTKDNIQSTHTFNVSQNQLEHPKFIDYKKFNLDTKLSARMINAIVVQLTGVIGASVEKQRKRLYIRSKLINQGLPTTLLDRKIKQNIPTIPNLDNLNMEISSNCLVFIKTTGHFEGFLKFKSLGLFKEFYVPVKFHKLNKKYKDWEMKGSFLVSDKCVNIRWHKEDPELRKEGVVVGADQGFKTCLTLSDSQITKPQPTPNPNVFHDLESIVRKMSRKRSGSKAFKKAQSHRKNYIHWALNQLDLGGVKEIRFEKIWNIGYKKNSGNVLRHWTKTIIRDGFEDICNRNGVRFIEVESTYKSQRCFVCGMVKKGNRRGKEYRCSCGHVMDSDLNSSKNQVLDLPYISYDFRRLGLNVAGFYWLESGIFDLDGVEYRVPLSKNEDNCQR